MSESFQDELDALILRHKDKLSADEIVSVLEMAVDVVNEEAGQS